MRVKKENMRRRPAVKRTFGFQRISRHKITPNCITGRCIFFFFGGRGGNERGRPNPKFSNHRKTPEMQVTLDSAE